MQTPPEPIVVDSVLDLIGNTPIVRLRRLGRAEPRAEVWAKMEEQNPGGAAQDRVALAMVVAAERAGALAQGGVVVEATSGNTGIGLALVCASRGYRCTVAMPESMSLERRQTLEALGARVVETPAEEQMSGAIAGAREVAGRERGALFIDQFSNEAAPRAHAETTAREILLAMAGLSIDAFVAGVGSGATLSGVAGVLRSETGARIVAVEPASCPTLSRGERGPTKIQGLGPGFVPKHFRREIVDEVRLVTDRDARRTTHALARQEGLLVGMSAGAQVFAALEVARGLGPGKNVVTTLPDTGERYFSLESFFEDDGAA